MIVNDLFKLTLKDVKSGGVRSLLVLLSVAVGAASLIAFVAQAEGMRYNVESQFRGLSANVIIGISGVPSLTYQDLIVLRSFYHVVDVKGAIMADVQVSVAGKYENFKLVGMDTDTFYTIFPSATSKYGSVNLDAPDLASIGHAVYKKARIGVNALLPVKFHDKTFYVRISGVLAPLGVSPLAVGFEPDKAIFVNINDVKAFLNVRKMNLVYVIIDSPGNVDKAYKEVENYLKGKQFQVFAPLSIIKVYMSAVSFAERFLLAMSLMAFVASGFSIANTMMITVIERTREIGVMKAVGFTSRQIMLYYLMLAASYGIIGGIVGSIIGYALANVVSKYMSVIGAGIEQYVSKYFSMKLPSARVTHTLVLEALFFSIVTAIVSGMYPAYKASRLDPVQALKSE
jgi:putative ABC transport system permease protein